MKLSRIRRRRNLQGFSLIELLIVIAIIGLMAGVSIPAFLNFMKSFRLRTAGRQVLGDMNFARQHAITASKDTLIFFDIAAAAYDVVESNRANGVVVDSTLVNSYRLRPVSRLPKFVDMVDSTPTTGQPNVKFQNDSLDTIQPRPTLKSGVSFSGPTSYTNQMAVVFRPNGTVASPGMVWVQLQGESGSRSGPRYSWMSLEANSVGKISTALGPP